MSLFGIASAIFVISVLVFVHELGHFLVAKYFGVGVLRFSIGFGPVIWKFRKSETTYQLCCIPLGGYVRMVGDLPDIITGDNTDTTGKTVSQVDYVDNKSQCCDEQKAGEAKKEEFTREELDAIADKSRWFIKKPPCQQAAIIAAGPMANFFLAILLTSITLFFAGIYDSSNSTEIGGIARKMPAGLVGLELGDIVQKVNGVVVNRWADLLGMIVSSHGETVKLEVKRGEQELTFSVTPIADQSSENLDESQKRYVIGILPKFNSRDVGLFESVKTAVKINLKITYATLHGIFSMISRQISPKELRGPIFIFSESGNQAEKGWDRLLDFMSILSISLAVLNLLPIPILDGGHLFFLLLEAIFGSISIRRKEIAQQFGAFLLMAIMITAVYNDFTSPSVKKSDDMGWDFGEPKKSRLREL